MDAYDSLSSVNHWQKYWTRWRLRHVLMNERDLNVLMIKTCSRASVAREIDDATYHSHPIHML